MLASLPARTLLLTTIAALGTACGGATPALRSAEGAAASRNDRSVHLVRVSPEVAPLVRALESRLTVWTRRDGRRVFAKHCRNDEIACERRIAALAEVLHEVAVDHELDPYLLAALAVHESLLNAFVLGARGEAGIMQLHPRGAGHDVPYVHDASLRERCRHQADACQTDVVTRGAQTLRDSIARCGSLRAALGRYASGRCHDHARYIDAVLEERDELRERASE